MSDFISLEGLRRFIEGNTGQKINLKRSVIYGDKMTLFVSDRFKGDLYVSLGGPIRGLMFHNQVGGSACFFVHAVVFDSELLPGKRLSLLHALRVGFPVSGEPLKHSHLGDLMRYEHSLSS